MKYLFPTYVGVILQLREQEYDQDTFPHIRGGDPYLCRDLPNIRYFSPHTWG